MILETWTESERVALKQIEVQLLHMFREGRNGDQLYDYLVTCQSWTSARVVIFAALIAGGAHGQQRIEAKESENELLLDKEMAKLKEAIEMKFSDLSVHVIKPKQHGNSKF